jgi:hypothetical protein
MCFVITSEIKAQLRSAAPISDEFTRLLCDGGWNKHNDVRMYRRPLSRDNQASTVLGLPVVISVHGCTHVEVDTFIRGDVGSKNYFDGRASGCRAYGLKTLGIIFYYGMGKTILQCQ